MSCTNITIVLQSTEQLLLTFIIYRASFIRILPSETISSQANATSQAFYIIRGSGSSSSEFGEITWNAGDLFVLPATSGDVIHTASTETAIYWITDEPLMSYLGVSPDTKKFKPTVFRRERMLAEVEAIRHQPGAEHRNRLGILLGINKSQLS